MNPFTTLNLDKLKEIADRWATQFQRQGGQYNRITLHRYESPLLTEDTSLRWAIVFDMTHYECQEMTREEALVNTMIDPHLWFIRLMRTFCCEGLKASV